MIYRVLFATVACFAIELTMLGMSANAADFRQAVEQTLPRVVAVRPRSSAEQGQRSPTEYQHALRLNDQLIVTVDPMNVGEWELETSHEDWIPLRAVVVDRVSDFVILTPQHQSPKGEEQQRSQSLPALKSELQKLFPTDPELALPVAALWYDEGHYQVKSTIVSGSGGMPQRGLWSVDLAGSTVMLGVPIVDAAGNWIGLTTALPQTLRVRQLRIDGSRLDNPTIPPGLTVHNVGNVADAKAPAAYQPLRQPLWQSFLIAPASVIHQAIERLPADLRELKEPIILEPGLVGIRVGQGDGAIINLVEGGPAEIAGAQAADKIIRVNSDTISNDLELFRALNKYRAGDTLEIEVERKNKEGSFQRTTIALTMIPRPLEIRVGATGDQGGTDTDNTSKASAAEPRPSEVTANVFLYDLQPWMTEAYQFPAQLAVENRELKQSVDELAEEIARLREALKQLQTDDDDRP